MWEGKKNLQRKVERQKEEKRETGKVEKKINAKHVWCPLILELTSYAQVLGILGTPMGMFKPRISFQGQMWSLEIILGFHKFGVRKSGTRSGPYYLWSAGLLRSKIVYKFPYPLIFWKNIGSLGCFFSFIMFKFPVCLASRRLYYTGFHRCVLRTYHNG